MSPDPRLGVEAREGRVAVVDRDRPGAPLVELALPGGTTVMVAEHLCGWTAAGAAGGALWPSQADAVAALGGPTADGRPWVEVLEEYAAGLGAPEDDPA